MKPVFTFLAFLICIQLFACNKNKEMTSTINDNIKKDSTET